MQLSILKTGALGDVLRTTSILPGLAARYPDLRVTWLTADGAADLVRHHPLVDEVVTCKPSNAASIRSAGERLAGTKWQRVISLDDEEPLCALATRLTERSGNGVVDDAGSGGILSGAYLAADGSRRYTDDVSPWFDMGLLSRFGKAEADRRKVANQRSHPEIYAEMLGIAKGEPELPLPPEDVAFASELARRSALHEHGRVIGMNTGSGGRWESKKLPIDRTVQVMESVAAGCGGAVTFLILGGPEEAARNADILARTKARLRVIDAGTDNSLLRFAALVDRLQLLVTSDSLALHIANARRVPIVAFFAPTSAAEVDLYGRGASVKSTSPDYCSYRKDADTSTLTVERLVDPILQLLRVRAQRRA